MKKFTVLFIFLSGFLFSVRIKEFNKDIYDRDLSKMSEVSKAEHFVIRASEIKEIKKISENSFILKINLSNNWRNNFR